MLRANVRLAHAGHLWIDLSLGHRGARRGAQIHVTSLDVQFGCILRLVSVSCNIRFIVTDGGGWTRSQTEGSPPR